MKKLVLVPHNMGSTATRDLAAKLSEKVGHKVFRVTPDNIRGRVAFVLHGGTDKLTQMNRFKEESVNVPEFTTDRNLAASWLADGPVVCRTVLRGSEGRGIVVAETHLTDAPLYTKYFKKKREYRVHVLNGQVIDVQEKRRRAGVEGGDTRIRNLANGYVFCRDNITEPEGLRSLAVLATSALGYSLGAVDIAFNEHHNHLVVFEVNANPGMQGTTLDKYADAIVASYKAANAL